MFDDLRPDEIPAPPPNALNAAVHRGTSIRRRRRTAWVAGVATAVVVGIAVVLSNPFSTTDSAHVVPATAAPTAPPDYSRIPDGASEQDGVSFGFLEKITTGADGTLTLLIQPGYYLTGEAAKEANDGVVPPDDYLSDVKKGTKPTEFRLDPKATLEGANVLLGFPDTVVPEGKAITPAQMTSFWKKAQDEFGTENVSVWFRLSDDGRITALREPFIP